MPADWDPGRDEDVDRVAGPLLHRFRERDEHESFTLLVELTQPDCARIARTLVRQLGLNLDADDLVASFFARLFVDTRKGQPPIARFLGWARIAMRNEALNQLRHYRRAQARHEVFMRRRLMEGQRDPAAEADALEEDRLVRRLALVLAAAAGRAFAELGERDRRILAARELEDGSYEDLARNLGLPRGQVGMILKRARERLVRLLARILQPGADGADPPVRPARRGARPASPADLALHPTRNEDRPRSARRAAGTPRGPGRGPECA